MPNYIVRALIPEETWVTANNITEAQALAKRWLHLKAHHFAPGFIHSVEPFNTVTPVPPSPPVKQVA